MIFLIASLILCTFKGVNMSKGEIIKIDITQRSKFLMYLPSKVIASANIISGILFSFRSAISILQRLNECIIRTLGMPFVNFGTLPIYVIVFIAVISQIKQRLLAR